MSLSKGPILHQEGQGITGGHAVGAQLEQSRGGVADVLDTYAGMRKIQITLNGETREIYLDNENLRVDSSNWRQIAIRITVKGKIKRIGVKISPEGGVMEYIDGPAAGQQLFANSFAAEREAKKTGKRLPFAHDENNEFEAIIKEVGVKDFMRVLPGSASLDDNYGSFLGTEAYFWAASHLLYNAYFLKFRKKSPEAVCGTSYKNNLFSVRLVKDPV